MPLTLLVVLVAVVLSLLRGGRLRRLANAPIRATGLLVTGLALQVGVDVTAAQGLVGGAVSGVVLVLSQVLVVGWVVANRYRAGMPLILLGLLMNLVVIAANGAMPVDPDAVSAAGGPTPVIALGKHETLTDASRLAFLADIFAIPLLRTVVSAGDVVLAAGLIPLAHDLMTYRPPHVRRGGHRRQDSARSVPNDSPESDEVVHGEDATTGVADVAVAGPDADGPADRGGERPGRGR